MAEVPGISCPVLREACSLRYTKAGYGASAEFGAIVGAATISAVGWLIGVGGARVDRKFSSIIGFSQICS